ncbi:hypothetical protein RhiirA1_444398 [Rhizophagus irregularis]|uniref:Uncharacterized protein n=1 Tax=Rhizophagus irregularis TaxID=588596 RepID=A0A2I1EH93_9GLOM|nr:hypothetical protein RhiirA1_444398 [Rhizophagus irregularis]PKY21502.1 hypothetical protein RhiirB3_470362 [Rhizophagus irregularis]
MTTLHCKAQRDKKYEKVEEFRRLAPRDRIFLPINIDVVGGFKGFGGFGTGWKGRTMSSSGFVLLLHLHNIQKQNPYLKGSQRARATITANVTTTTTATATTTNIATITATTATTTATATIAATAIATIITTAPATTALTTAHTAPFDPLDNSMYQNNNLSEEISKLFSPLKTMKREQKEY